MTRLEAVNNLCDAILISPFKYYEVLTNGNVVVSTTFTNLTNPRTPEVTDNPDLEKAYKYIIGQDIVIT